MLFLLPPSVVYPVPPDGLFLPSSPSSSASSPLSTKAVQYRSSIHPFPSFHTSISVSSSDSLLSKVSLGSSDEVSEIYTSLAVNLHYSNLVPISDGVADFANATLLGATNSKPPLVSDASPPRASWPSVVQ
ncbi:hypothetical protein Nepgr_006575 [Nepenthes gracilis]|uniref:Uncharacterized protein n=1 Tax=Nepenthes gracilis TaxID=150966 RepID=A0AAD3S5E8_NEPGR|nr:hypothetical protein Nepgr_006575 [Nepenthes gracilis]